MGAFGSIAPPPPSSISNVISVDESGAIPALGRVS